MAWTQHCSQVPAYIVHITVALLNQWMTNWWVKVGVPTKIFLCISLHLLSVLPKLLLCVWLQVTPCLHGRPGIHPDVSECQQPSWVVVDKKLLVRMGLLFAAPETVMGEWKWKGKLSEAPHHNHIVVVGSLCIKMVSLVYVKSCVCVCIRVCMHACACVATSVPLWLVYFCYFKRDEHNSRH